MAGWLTPGFPLAGSFTGNETLYADTNLTQGQSPESVGINIVNLAAALSFFSNSSSITTVNGTRYYTRVVLGTSFTATGVAALVGSTGGTDKFIYELHDSAGNLLATTALAGVTVAAAGTWQQIPFTAPITVPAGTYFVAVQSNGTTAKIGAYNAPNLTIPTGSATGTFGTSASITPPTTYTAGVGPQVMLY